MRWGKSSWDWEPEEEEKAQMVGVAKNRGCLSVRAPTCCPGEAGACFQLYPLFPSYPEWCQLPARPALWTLWAGESGVERPLPCTGRDDEQAEAGAGADGRLSHNKSHPHSQPASPSWGLPPFCLSIQGSGRPAWLEDTDLDVQSLILISFFFVLMSEI